MMFLHTHRLLIRNFNASDLEAFWAYRNDPQVAKFQSWSLPYSREKGEALIREMQDIHTPRQGEWLQLALELKETGELIGDVVFGVKENDARQCSVGFTIASACQKNGFATEAMTALLDYLFEDVDMHRVVADCDTENVGSWKTLEKLGFRREAQFVESFMEGKEYRSEYFYGLLQREWRAKAAFRNC
ncbi:MAG: ribosomal-protein-serine acetyltransferase [Anaerolineaceae bacterium]|nr:MAG: ribosomal-protein-serine acetyltransferase [Anaerolineaceae bacterium]